MGGERLDSRESRRHKGRKRVRRSIIGVLSMNEGSFGRRLGMTETSKKDWHGSRRSSEHRVD